MTDLLTPPVRVVLAAVCLGLAWWAFGRGERRRPWALAACGLAAAWLALAGEAVSYLIYRDAKWWLPTVAVGVAASWFAVRGRRGTAAGRAWAAGAVALCVAAPLLSRAEAVIQSRYDLGTRFLGFVPAWNREVVLREGLRGTAILLAAVFVAAAAWQRRTEPDDAPDGGPR